MLRNIFVFFFCCNLSIYAFSENRQPNKFFKINCEKKVLASLSYLKNFVGNKLLLFYSPLYHVIKSTFGTSSDLMNPIGEPMAYEIDRQDDFLQFASKKNWESASKQISIDLFRSHVKVFYAGELIHRYSAGILEDVAEAKEIELTEASPLGPYFQDLVFKALQSSTEKLTASEINNFHKIAAYTVFTRGQGYEFECVKLINSMLKKYNDCTYPNSLIEMSIIVDKGKILAVNRYHFDIKIENKNEIQEVVGRIDVLRHLEIDVRKNKIFPERIVLIESALGNER